MAERTLHYTYYQPLGPVGEERGGFMLTPGLDTPADHRYIPVYEGTVTHRDEQDLMIALEAVWATHNAGDRPRGREIRSMCVGDICDLGEYGVWVVDMVGWRRIEEREIPELLTEPPPGLGYPVTAEPARGPTR